MNSYPQQQLRWFKSTYSGGSGNECVEAACVSGGILVRDSARIGHGCIAVEGSAWSAFVHGLPTEVRPRALTR
ncbi:DUF397 domain-containing protein [Streptomyces sp. NBC_01003]|uniref:DUF397 domain-containing protein n=1 Tax=Streptomyces sp. NBC_01003 TaxID=2903714 RepID=UPI003864E357|nr:DUF397 domain-containing protein [Streptomyces sp. NBC_01003]